MLETGSVDLLRSRICRQNREPDSSEGELYSLTERLSPANTKITVCSGGIWDYDHLKDTVRSADDDNNKRTTGNDQRRREQEQGQLRRQRQERG